MSQEKQHVDDRLECVQGDEHQGDVSPVQHRELTCHDEEKEVAKAPVSRRIDEQADQKISRVSEQCQVASLTDCQRGKAVVPALEPLDGGIIVLTDGVLLIRVTVVNHGSLEAAIVLQDDRKAFDRLDDCPFVYPPVSVSP